MTVLSRQTISQHLDMLETSGLVTSIKNGRVRTYRLTPAALEHAGAWIADQREQWTRRLDQLDSHLQTHFKRMKETS